MSHAVPVLWKIGDGRLACMWGLEKSEWDGCVSLSGIEIVCALQTV